YLYSTNTLGAAVGCFAAGYYLLLELGVQATLNVACGVYLVASPGLFDALTGLFMTLAAGGEARAGLTLARVLGS
ncbi:MAG: hypothetical protein R6X35_05050, partial [Candidatus Krumholzibacteriia bacterium]